jgi:hypothetical protein
MAIHEPGRRLMHLVPLKFVQKRVGGGGGHSLNAELNLTSFIDFLIVVVVFLLMTFSASGEIPIQVRIDSARDMGHHIINPALFCIVQRKSAINHSPGIISKVIHQFRSFTFQNFSLVFLPTVITSIY